MKNILICCLLLTIACSPSNKIELLNGVNYQLAQGELNKRPDGMVQNTYFNYYVSKEIQTPLFKYIKHSYYAVYVGLPINTSLTQMQGKQLLVPDAEILSEVSKENYSFRKYKSGQSYISELIIELNKSLFYVLFVTTSEKVNKEQLTEASIVSRFVK